MGGSRLDTQLAQRGKDERQEPGLVADVAHCGSAPRRRKRVDHGWRQPNAPQPRDRISSPCSLSRGGGSRTVPGTLGPTPYSGDASASASASFTVWTSPHGTPASASRAIQWAAGCSMSLASILATTVS